MSQTIGRERKLFSNLREDNWWISPMLVLFGLLCFIVYSTWAAWQGEYFWWSGARPNSSVLLTFSMKFKILFGLF